MYSGFVLHARPWRETSLILELLTFEHGRMGVLARGARRPRKGGAASLQPFNLLALDWRGKGELPTLVGHELVEAFTLTGDALYAGLYLNELLIRVLRRDLPQPDIFRAYNAALVRLSHAQPLEPCLRILELELIQALGFGISLHADADGAPIVEGVDYTLQTDVGLSPATTRTPAEARFAGAQLLRIAAHDFADDAARRTAKRLTRSLLAPLLGERPLQSRALFRQRVAAFRKPG